MSFIPTYQFIVPFPAVFDLSEKQPREFTNNLKSELERIIPEAGSSAANHYNKREFKLIPVLYEEQIIAMNSKKLSHES
ncbi:hypothetical protein [Fluviicola sp.]|uniref:hypothetical protein n=1 Tax=Fluviicola sp. TaxID=1917219 RepID=UPI0031E262B0